MIQSLRQPKALTVPHAVDLFNRASPSIVAAGVLAACGLVFNLNQQVTQINGTLRTMSEQFVRISTRVDTLEASIQSAELEIREIQTVIRGGSQR
jgi:septal ring factor EnvC (AmiA/AmiB activator)